MRHILCFGNPLHGDDGFGHAVYKRLANLPQPVGQRLIDAGTPGPAALGLFQDCDEVIVVDALTPGHHPGKLFELAPDEIMNEVSLAGHGVGIGFLLKALDALSEQPPVIRIIAVEAISVMPFQPGLSKAVAEAVDEAATLLSVYFTSNKHE